MRASRRLVVGGLVLLVALTLVSGLWLWSRLVTSAPEGRPTAPSAPTAPPTTIAGFIPTPLRAPPGYRLAGVAVGEPESFAVIEAPHGAHALYRVGAEVPGLGRIIRIEAERIVVQIGDGQFELWLAPAPTATATRARTVSTRTVAARTPARAAVGTNPPVAQVFTPSTPTPPLPARGGRVAGSTPSAVPDRPAS